MGYVELKAYQDLTGEVFTPWEADLMVKIEQARGAESD